MNIDVNVDISEALNLTQKVIRKLPYAMNSALTETAKLVVSAEQLELRRDFTMRKTFLQNRFKILQYSRVSNLTAIVGVDANVQGSPLLLGFFEDGGMKEPDLGPSIAEPITGSPARPSIGSAIPTSLLYKNLQITHGSGKKATFVIPGVGVFQRVGRGGRAWDPATKKMRTVDYSKTKMLYAFKSSAPLHKRTHMVALAESVIAESFDRIFAKNFVQELLGS